VALGVEFGIDGVRVLQCSRYVTPVGLKGTYVTEIPEHLLKRSQERRAAAGLSTTGDATPATTGAATPVAAAAATPARAAAPMAPVVAPPKPVPAYVTAAQTRRKVPIWAMPVVVFLPLWLWMYVLATQKPTVTVTGPLKEGSVVYNNCASCHAADGGGGVGYQLSGGSIVKTFPTIESQINFVYNGTKGYNGIPYGDAARGRIGGAKGKMPTWGSKVGGELSDTQIVAVICHERYSLGGVDPATAAKAEYVKEQAEWCTAEGAKWAIVEAKGLTDAGVDLSVK
jgi:mono/diheme cytochrome c family protein